MESTLLIKRRDAIILTTIDAINEYGIQAISTKDLAKRQGVSERIIFNHFPTKNDLLLAVLDHFKKYDNAIIQTAESKKMNPIEAITYFFDSFSTYYEGYPAISSITQYYAALLINPYLRETIQSIFYNRAAFIEQKIDEAKKLNMINNSLNSEDLADIILGNFSRLCLKWRMQDYDFSLREKTIVTLEMMLKSFSK